MPLPRLDLRSKSRRRFSHLGKAIETLELRRLMCTLQGDDLEQALVDDYLRNGGQNRVDHNLAWYTPTGTTTLSTSGGELASASNALARASGDIVPSGVTVTTNAAGLPLLTQRADGQGLKIFLDFDGYGTDTPFSTDADGSTFNASEQQIIYDTWRDIVSFFAPLNVNVTTVQPPTGGSNPVFAWQRISNSISGGAAYVGWLTNDSSNGWTGSENATGRHSGIAHEIGHQLGLSHQSEYNLAGEKTDEYSDGIGNRDRTIIGIDFATNVREWFYGRNSDSVLNLQDDMAVMANSIATRIGGDGYRPDDVAGTMAGATQVPANGLIAGLLERVDDTDVYKFTSTGNTYQIGATPTFESSTSPKIELLDANGNIIASRDDADRRNTNNNAQEFSVNLSAGTYYVRVSSSGDIGEQGEYLLTAAPLPGTAAQGWTTQDIGASTIWRAGTAAFDPTNNTLTQIGGGSDIWSTSDEFRFTSATLTGDGSITARIDALDNVDANAKAGVMIRSTTAANSAHVYVGIKPSGQLDPIVRTTAGGTAAAVGNPASATGPWVRLTRAGNLFTIERSSDGVSWSTYGTTSVSMGSTTLIGFATNARNTRAQAYSTFSNISVTGALGIAAPTYNNLAAPTGLTAAPATGANTSMNLAWTAVADALGYLIERSFEGVTYAALNTVAAGVTAYTDANQFGSMRYWYRVSSMGSASTRSVPSTPASVVNKPSAPTNPSSSYAQPAIRFSTTQLLLNWTDVQGDNGYTIERSTGGGAYSVIGSTTRNHNAYNDSGLVANTAYSYRITPVTSVGDGVAASLIINATTPLVAPPNFRITARTTGSFTLAWTDIAGETAYRLERSTDNATWSTIADLPSGTTGYTDSTGLAVLTHYYYRLRGLDTNSQYGVGAIAFGATPDTAALPAGWTDNDVGTVPGPGAGGGTTGGTWTVLGSGNDIWNNADQFNYVNRGLTGDGSIVARLTGYDVTDYYVKSGVMIRASTAANSPYIFMHYSDGPGLQVEFRDSAGAGSGNQFVLASTARWLKLARVGNVFTASYSSDGSTWTVAGTRTIAMPTAVTMGLAATSHNVSLMTKATFDNVTTTGAGTTTNTAPVITSATASPATIAASTTTLTAVATDDGGAAGLSYAWSIVSKPVGVNDPTFSINNTNAASTSIATFYAAGNYTFRVTVTDAGGLTATKDVSAAVTLRTTSSYDWDKPQPQFTVLFNGNIGGTLDASDLVLTNLTTGNVIPAGQITAAYTAGTNQAVFKFTAGPNGTLPDGRYQAKILAGSVAETSGVALATDVTYNFFVKAGDANHDGNVDFSDLVILAQNYGQTGKTPSAGNVDYDPQGRVDFSDLVLLAQNYGTSLPSVAAITLPDSPAKTKGTRLGGATTIV